MDNEQWNGFIPESDKQACSHIDQIFHGGINIGLLKAHYILNREEGQSHDDAWANALKRYIAFLESMTN